MTRLQGIGWVMALVAGLAAFIVILAWFLEALPREEKQDEGE